MVQREIEETYEEVVVETEEETVTFCDGCTEEAEDYVTLSNVSRNCLDEALGHRAPSGREMKLAHQIQRLKENAEEFHICAGCQKGLREHGRTIDTALYDAPEPEEDSGSKYDMSKTHAYMAAIALLTVVFLFLGGLGVMLFNPVGGVGMIVIGVVLILALIVDPPEQ